MNRSWFTVFLPASLSLWFKSMAFITAFFVTTDAYADIRLPAILSSNMVLQQKTEAALWGWAEPGEKVVVSASWHVSDSAITDGNGKWKIHVKTSAAGGPYRITLKGNNTLVLENVMIGEVWICSGQSNMEMNFYWGLPQMKEDIPQAFNKNIRFFHIPRSTATHPQERMEGNWTICDSNTVKSFSAVAYYFGKKLEADLNVPIGLIHASWGGTPAEAWTPAYVVNHDSVLKNAAAKLSSSKNWPVQPGLAWNSMIAPVTPFQIAGAIWYQGESNTGTASTYHHLFSSMIRSWRQEWKNEFPFLFVQLAPYAYDNRNIGALLREAQDQTLEVPGTGMVVTTDIGGDTTDIHPRNKKDVGYRLAALALADVYHQEKGIVESPRFGDIIIEDKIAIITVEPVQALQVKGNFITGFEIAGEDKRFYPAEAEIIGNKIYVWNDMVSKPLEVRYAFSNTALGNVVGENGLPLAPFRTDKWDVDTSLIKK